MVSDGRSYVNHVINPSPRSSSHMTYIAQRYCNPKKINDRPQGVHSLHTQPQDDNECPSGRARTRAMSTMATATETATATSSAACATAHSLMKLQQHRATRNSNAPREKETRNTPREQETPGNSASTLRRLFLAKRPSHDFGIHRRAALDCPELESVSMTESDTVS